ncbi:transcriptional regulator [Xanthomonas fragariae]|uniref:Uncharacterized protein n=1 Tax=Xanthomonas fragariae TaxID=48664 RepID=A0A1Y6HHV8_9XANT|nr:hypothetical protein [Xanthomonas fragariae]AOD13500.1 hypothetical protein BER92_00505 [Xanthomonas fragariae]AOD16887.1 hypothetical protein BER93_00500 [Xanthomonas fragariae]ENZ93829.1 HTH-type transcriptional regulator [Xanthomonas fragariae LMG 25863]ENZ96045.1 HTH-type transcriptional regulator [Xanthomonas fragariae LMG 25863]ENZ96467.1 HTH-type transcriptional regulator [Xanthomonas fragariae LMG 25863]
MAEDTSFRCILDRISDIRVVLEPIADKWSIMIMTVVCNRATALRQLERVGLISRKVILSSLVAVQYRRTALGDKLEAPRVALLY